MEKPDDSDRKRFVWGVRLAWGSFLILFLPALVQTFGSISEQKATGLGAVAGGLSEGFFTFGLTLAVVLQLTALTLLARSFSAQHSGRALFSLLSMACSMFILAVAGVVIWFSYLR